MNKLAKEREIQISKNGAFESYKRVSHLCLAISIMLYKEPEYTMNFNQLSAK